MVALQRRLSALHYWLGDADGVFGSTTQQAVFALQKASGLTPDGVVGPSTRAALDHGTEPPFPPAAGRVVDVDLHLGLLMVQDGGRLVVALNASTGGGYTYVQDGQAQVADTPQGIFHIFRVVDGLVVNSLGELWRPRFFVGGYAIHGGSSVPPYPVSHGCVRVSNDAIDWIWSADLMPVGTEVVVY